MNEGIGMEADGLARGPATAFGAGVALTIPDTTQIDTIPAEALPA
jgi:hypothetical protein